MKTTELIQTIEKNQLKTNLPVIAVGDTVIIGVRIQEGNKQRIQPYEGTVIAKANTGVNTAITVRRVFQGVSIERIFLIHSPSLENISVVRNSKVRRAKLYYLRNRIGKTARLVQRFSKSQELGVQSGS
jgi:large subunit ribosomal protein L19